MWICTISYHPFFYFWLPAFFQQDAKLQKGSNLRKQYKQ